jgi:UDP-3-O-[3-hydroxymyristoyl] glucosamine N-acyltransferase
MIAITCETAFPRFEYLLLSNAEIDEILFLEYKDYQILVPEDLLDRLRSTTAVLLFDNIHLNYTKMELYARLRLAGVRFNNLISPQAFIAPSVRLGENVVIHHGVKIDSHTTIKSTIEIQEHTVVKDHCNIGSGVYLGHNSYIESNVKIGSNVNLGNHLTVNKNVTIGNNVSYEVDHQTIDADISAGSFFSKLFPSVYRCV